MSPFARRKNSAKAAIDRAVRDAFAAIPGHHAATTAAFQRLLRHVRRRSDLLHPPGGAGRHELKGYDDVLAGLLSLATFDWLRPVEDWEPAGDNPLPQFSSLARHLLAAYPVPAFMTSAWLKGPDAEARRQQRWYAHVGSGRNIRTADLPLPYTKRMAHHFLQAPRPPHRGGGPAVGPGPGDGRVEAAGPGGRRHPAGPVVRGRGLLGDRRAVLRGPPRTRPRPGRPGRGLLAPPAVRAPGRPRRGGRVDGPGAAAAGPLDEGPDAEVSAPAGPASGTRA